MPLLQADAAKLTQDMLLRGVIETLFTESAILRLLPFMTVVGSAVDYNQELTLPTADFYAVDDPWNEDAPTYVQKTAHLCVLGGDADVDQFVQQVYANINNIRALVIQSKAKALANKFNQTFYYGNSGVDPNAFDGLATAAGAAVAYAAVDATHRAFYAGANGATLTLPMMDQLMDAVRPGKPDVLLMSKRSRRKLSALRRASGNLLEVGVNAFGQRALYYDGIPIEVDENIPDTETQGNTAINSSIFAAQFGEMKKVSGLQNGMIQAVPIGNLEGKDAWRTRLKWYVSLAIFTPWSYAILRGVQD